jgi:hypothetical protein
MKVCWARRFLADLKRRFDFFGSQINNDPKNLTFWKKFSAVIRAQRLKFQKRDVGQVMTVLPLPTDYNDDSLGTGDLT